MKDALRNLAQRIAQTKALIQTEEATKNAYIMPFLQALGYDVFNPLEIIPEFTADVGLKEGEKVDYAIMINGKPAVLIECKCCNNDLNVQNESQLLRYFHTTEAKFGLLTNGIVYQFYSDLVEPNKMDMTPFLVVNLGGDLAKINYAELEKFRKENFDMANIRKTAEMMKCTNDMTNAVKAELATPSEDFVRVLFKRFSAAPFTPAQRDRYMPLAKTCIDALISEKVKTSLDTALKHTSDEQAAVAEAQAQITQGDETGIVTTEEEKEGFLIVKAISAEVVPAGKIEMRDAKSYCAVLFEDNNRKPVVRLFFNNPEKMAVMFFDKDLEEKVPITQVQDLYQYKTRILATIKKYMPEEKA